MANKYKLPAKPRLVLVPDSEILMVRFSSIIFPLNNYDPLQENLVENKHHRLARSERSGIADREAKPTAL